MKLEHSISRLEGFSDGVFALAATLMMIKLGTSEDFLIMENRLVTLVSFAISFMSLVLIWLVHYRFFRRINKIDNIIIFFNMVLLFVILYFMLPLRSLIASWFKNIGLTQETLGELFQLYGLGFCLIFAMISSMYFWSYKKNLSDIHGYRLYFYARHYFIFVLVGVFSIVLAYSGVGMKFALPGPVYGLLGPLCYAHSKWFEKKYDLGD